MADQPFLQDLQITGRTFDVQTSDREFVDLKTDFRGDLQTIGGRENLVQAIINRLLTRQGELAVLGHPTYGSRLYTLIGQPNNLRIRALADAYIREALAQDKRIAEVRFVTFNPPGRGDDRSTLRATISVQPIGQEAGFSIILPINLEG